jgi:hypothetical protein
MARAGARFGTEDFAGILACETPKYMLHIFIYTELVLDGLSKQERTWLAGCLRHSICNPWVERNSGKIFYLNRL